MEPTSILRRKTGASRPPAQALAMTSERALTLAFGRAGRDMPGLGLRLASVGMARGSLSVLPAQAGPATLILTLARDGTAAGALLVDPGLVSALIEAETMGCMATVPPPDRPPTRIDALIAAGFFDRVLIGFDEAAAGLSIAAAVVGFRTGAPVPAAAALPLLLDDRPMRLFRLAFDLGDGQRQAGAMLAMPFDPPRAEAPDAEFGIALKMAVLAAPAQVRAVLTRLALPLAAVTDWQPGDLVPLPREALGRLILEDIDGHPVAVGRLGQVSGMRAVRLIGDAAVL